MQIAKRVVEAAEYLRRSGAVLPVRALALEVSMAGFSNELAGLSVLPLRRIPGLPEPRRGARSGALLLGRLGGVPTAVVEGRTHLYEGYLPGECALALRTLAAVGVRSGLLVAEGRSLREGLAPGTMFLVTDWIDRTGVAYLKGMLDAPGGPLIAVPPAPPELERIAQTAGASTGVPVATGVAALLHGPLLPTPAERRVLLLYGAEVIALALAAELAAAIYAGMRTAALLVIDGAWDKPHLDFCRIFLEGFAPPEAKTGPKRGLDEASSSS